MHKWFAELWAEALESGEYEQGHDRLTTVKNNTVRHCCLGVAVELAIKKGLKLSSKIHPTRSCKVYFLEGDTRSEEDCYLPKSVAHYMGLTAPYHDPCVELSEELIKEFNTDSDHGSSRITFTGLNDGLRLTFPQIAKVIREMYL